MDNVIFRELPFEIAGVRHRVAVRALTPQELHELGVESETYLYELTAEVPDARKDRDLTDGVDEAGIIARGFRDPEDVTVPALPSAEWVREHCTADEIKALIRFYWAAIRG